MLALSRSRLAGRTAAARCRLASSFAAPDASQVDARNPPTDFEPASAVVYSDFISSSEGEALVKDISGRMKRRRYEKGHWDAVITDYKEVELLDQESLDVESQAVIERVRAILTEENYVTPSVDWLPCHAIDLKRDGELKAHVDSVKFSGDVVAGVSLLSPSIMRLKPDREGQEEPPRETCGWVDLYLPPLSLYILSGVSRYKYSHELLPSGSVFEYPDGSSVTVERDRRLSVIFRDAKRD